MACRYVVPMIIFGLSLGAVLIFFMTNRQYQDRLTPVFSKLNLTSKMISTAKRSQWPDNKLIVIPAIYKEIEWANRSSWPLWLRNGLNPQSSYHVHLYQRIDPNSTAPYDWPYCANRHEEVGVYLEFIYKYYYDLPKKMLFIHGDPFPHSPYPVEIAQCIRDDVHYASVNPGYFANRAWNMWAHVENETIGKMYRCASYVLSLFGFDGESQLNPNNLTPKKNNTIQAPCCAQFFVTRERIRHYTYKQWSAVYGANLLPYCVDSDDAETPGERETKWFAGSFEHVWHIILGFHPNDMELPRPQTTSDPCNLLRRSCKLLSCS